MPPITRESRKRRRGIERWRCGACLFELPEYLRTIDEDSPFQEDFIPNDRDYPRHWVEASVLVSSSKRGCRTCRHILLMTNLSSDSKEWLGDSMQWYRGVLLLSNGVRYQIFFLKSHGLFPKYPEKYHPFVDIGDFPSGNTRGPMAFGRVASYLRQCIDGHEVCAKSSAVRPMPQRIIYIEDYATSSARLIDGTHGMTPQPYLCLSHRWTAQTRESSLTRKCASLFQRAIPKEVLYPLLTDALEITQRLGYRYIWIDFLCIYQDDIYDWHQQASKMATIYENAEITISAVDAELNNGRIFSQKVPQAHMLDTHNDKEIFIRRVDNLHPRLTDIGDKNIVSRANPGPFPLLERGWVYQECLLSRRIIYFTRHELILECRQAVQCECRSEENIWAELKSHVPTVSEMDWFDICVDNSYTKLSRVSDKLPAMIGISTRFGEARGWTYLSGLWREDPDLAKQLIWSANTPRARPSVSIRLPSWSWASVNSSIGVYFNNPSKVTITFRIIDHEVLYGLNRYGTPRSAKLVVDGPCIPAILEYRPVSVTSISPEAELESQEVNFFLRIGESRATIIPDFSFNKPGEGHVHSGEDVMLFVCSLEKDGFFCAVGLVLKAVDVSRKIYERIGFTLSRFSPEFTSKQFQSLWEYRKLTLV